MNEERKKNMQQLNQLESQADRANEVMNNFQQELTAAATDIVFKHFPALKEMDGEEIKKFGKIISDHTWQLTMDLDALHFEVKKNC